MAREFTVQPIRCNCHPETCCCPSHEILMDGKRVARGSNKLEMEHMALAATYGSLKLEEATKVLDDE